MNPRHFPPLCGVRQATLGAIPVALVLSSLLAGCGGNDYQTVPVSGRVTLDGRPLADVGILFVPMAKDRGNPNVGPGSLGRTDAEGQFVLQTAHGDEGAVPAEHVVRMSLASGPGDPENAEDVVPEGPAVRKPASPSVKLPRNALDGSLRFEISPEGTDQANFDLVSQPRAK